MNQRKVENFLVNPRFQIRIVGFFIILTTVLLVMQVAGLYLFFAKFKSILLAIGLEEQHAIFTLLHKQEVFLYTLNAVIGGAVFILMLGGGIVLSHRVAGPIKKLENTLNSIDPGQPETLKAFTLRKNDFFPEIATALNNLLKRIKK